QCPSFASFLHFNFSGAMETNTPHLDDVFPLVFAGPVIKVKIPKDKDGKPKQFAFANFKREVSVPYAMNLLNGIKLFGRPIKLQFRSGSSHASQEVSLSYSQHHVGSSSPTSTSPSRYERTADNMTPSTPIIQRSFSSSENFQRQAVMNSALRQITGSGHAGSAALAHGPSRSTACGIFPDQGTNPCPLHRQADSQPLRHQGSPGNVFLKKLYRAALQVATFLYKIFKT
uniref:RRM domain-containing protein n=1 Tax=Phocoena sinus TaxID=42100 RepID=A0A8C9BTN0_PHOSS